MQEIDYFYFAYGSNLSRDRKSSRTGPIREARRCRLMDFRLTFNKKGRNGQVYANVESAPGQEVWGVLYRCDEQAMKKMDEHEGVSSGDYRRETVKVIADDGKVYAALAYVALKTCPEGFPSPDYLQKIVRGAKEHCLPDAYVSKIELQARQADRPGR